MTRKWRAIALIKIIIMDSVEEESKHKERYDVVTAEKSPLDQIKCACSVCMQSCERKVKPMVQVGKD
jgi:hypothetical protein